MEPGLAERSETMRALMAFLLGSLLVGIILIGFVAAENFFVVDRLIESPPSTEFRQEFQQRLAPLPDGEARVVLRYLSSELNRFYFRVWGGAEALLGAVLLLLAARSGPKGLNDRPLKIGAGVMLVLILLMTFYLTPQIVEVGRAIDFVPRDPPPPELRQFGMLHAAYSLLDLAKLLIGIWLTVRLVRRSPGQRTKASDG
jgi:hypothetical protein